MNTIPCSQPPGPPFDNKPRVIVLVEDLERIERELCEAKIEVERAKADRNKAALQERQKYIPQLSQLRSDLIGYGKGKG